MPTGASVRRATQLRALAVVESGWVAACMEPAEWELWVATNPRNATGGMAARPCIDCPLGFAAEMRAIGRCNGTPGGVGTDVDAEEGDEMTDELPRPSGGVRGATTMALTPPPCETCLHEPVCVLKVALKRADRAEITVVPLPDGLSVALEARIDCRFYNRRPGTPRAAWSPASREAARQRALARNPNRKAARA